MAEFWHLTGQLVSMIRAKIGISNGQQTRSAAVERPGGFPRTALERQRLVNERPTAWEHILWCSVMWSGLAELESKWFDHQLRVSRPSGLVYRADQAEAKP